MNLDIVKEIVNAVSGLGGDARMVMEWLIAYWAGRFVLGLGVFLFLAVKVLGILRDVVVSAMMAKRMQRDIGAAGVLVDSERKEIETIWREGMKAVGKGQK